MEYIEGYVSVVESKRVSRVRLAPAMECMLDIQSKKQNALMRRKGWRGHEASCQPGGWVFLICLKFDYTSSSCCSSYTFTKSLLEQT